nr:transposase [Cellulosilyticum sp. I15G10I2]
MYKISVGIDISEGKSTVCILKPYGEVISKPFEISHTEKDLSELVRMIERLDDEVRIVMEATGDYHLPVLAILKVQGFFIAVINPLVVKKYASAVLRKGKTDS